MKFLMFSALLISSSLSAQTINMASFKALMTQRQTALEKVAPAMSKKVLSSGSMFTEAGEECAFTQTAIQSVLKLQSDKMIVLSQEEFTPASSSECINAGFEAYKTKILYFEPLPSVAADVEYLTSVENSVIALSKVGEEVTMRLNLTAQQEDGTTTSDVVTVTYDLSKPSFKNITLNQGTGYSTKTTDIADIDLHTLDLSDVFFCENNDGDNSECVQGNYSDILF